MLVAGMKRKASLMEINALAVEEFAGIIAPVFEHSPWIAEAGWPMRPFASLEALHGTLCGVVGEAPAEKQLELIRAHPDLVGRAALAGTLTAASTNEQASAGLNGLTKEEIAAFQKYNQAYR